MKKVPSTFAGSSSGQLVSEEGDWTVCCDEMKKNETFARESSNFNSVLILRLNENLYCN